MHIIINVTHLYFQPDFLKFHIFDAKIAEYTLVLL